ncbi:acyl-CoA thioesterase [Streptomyces liangshanensis]|uniref:Acyl-CoA thioesterase n=1 Tax=Streptomyces liangshanensis TaxID=2717324 RepID=A0A6G9H667_9ACTN|nr:thioesterase family protein [Streptomyces liangshanensis]QIQ05796.1 acyl-CoA thioesterase [Streptomyces liangshanensis]
MTAGTRPTTDPVEFGVLIPVTVYFDDFDPMGLLHNSRYPVLVERAWVTYWERHGFGGRKFVAAEGDEFNVVKDLHIVFDQALNQVGEYAVHLWLEPLGRTSATAGFRVCSADGSVTYAHGTRTVIRLDPTTLRPVAWSDHVRALSATMLRPESDR